MSMNPPENPQSSETTPYRQRRLQIGDGVVEELPDSGPAPHRLHAARQHEAPVENRHLEEKRVLVEKLHRAGVLLAPSMLDTLTPARAQELLDNAGAELVVGPGASPVFDTPSLPRMLQPADLVSFTRRRFDTLRPLLAAKTESVSIAHLTPSHTATVIGSVRDLQPSGFVLEDLTGTLTVESSQSVTPGDVVAVTGSLRQDVFVAARLTPPDVPLHHTVPPLHTPLLLTTHPVNSITDTVICPSSLPCRITVSSLTLLAHQPPSPLTPERAVHHLQRRVFPAAVPAGDDLLLLEPLPALIWLIQDSAWQKNYKGVLIVSTGPGSRARVDTNWKVTFLSAAPEI